MGVRVKRCGKSAPPRQQCRGHGKPHTEQDQIGRESGLWFSRTRLRHVPARCVKPSGRSLEPRSNAWPRGMIVPPEQSGGQNSAYRSGCHNLLPSKESVLDSDLLLKRRLPGSSICAAEAKPAEQFAATIRPRAFSALEAPHFY